MPIPASTSSLQYALDQVRGSAAGIKGGAQSYLAQLQSGPINTDWVFQFLDAARFARDNLNAQASTPGLNVYATSQWSGYAGTLTTDIATVVANINACISWVAANFPTDAAGFIEGYKLNADGSRTPASFTSAQTAGLQTQLQALIASIE